MLRLLTISKSPFVSFPEQVAVPEEVAIVGAGNIRYSNCLKVPLATVDQGSYKIGQLADELLLKMLQNARYRKSERLIVQPKLIIRDSTPCPAASRK